MSQPATNQPVSRGRTDLGSADVSAEDTFRIAMVCLGNICRSPMAEAVLRARLAEADLDGRVVVESGGTGGWHVGEPADDRARRVLRERGYDADDHRARQVDAPWFGRIDLFLAMDRATTTELLTRRPPDPGAGVVQLLRLYDPASGDYDLDVPDPYYGDEDDFRAVLTMVERTVGGLVGAIAAELEAPEASGQP